MTQSESTSSRYAYRQRAKLARRNTIKLACSHAIFHRRYLTPLTAVELAQVVRTSYRRAMTYNYFPGIRTDNHFSVSAMGEDVTINFNRSIRWNIYNLQRYGVDSPGERWDDWP